MRVRLPALIAVISAAAYVACGSDDGSKTLQAGGEGGEGGDPTQNQAGKNATAGSQNNLGGDAGQGGAGSGGSAGMVGDAGAPLGGQGGASGSAGAGGSRAGSDGEGGNGGMGGDATTDPLVKPAACPSPVNGYTQLVGTEAADTFTADNVSGQKLIFGLGGDDVFPTEHGGDDCLVGGPGNDDFTNSDEFANYYVGGAGADTYHINTTGNYLRIADMEAGDTIALSLAKFQFLAGVPGETPSVNNVRSVPGYSTGTPSGVSEGSSIVYDPTSGELWLDWDGGTKGSSVNDAQILTILNKDGYQFSIDDFEID